MVGFGQTICKPIGPKCYNCGIKSLCPMTGKSIAPELRSKSKKKAVKVDDGSESDRETSFDSKNLVDSDEDKTPVKKASAKKKTVSKKVKK